MTPSPPLLLLFSLATDGILCAVIFFLWFRQRDAWHVLFWAVGQAALTACTAIGLLGPPDWSTVLALALTLGVGVGGFCCGTEQFLGHLRRRHRWHVVAAIGVASLLLFAAWRTHYQWIPNSMVWIIGATMLWSGGRLAGSHAQFRFLGWMLVLRGAFIFLIGYALLPFGGNGWLVCSAVLKTSSLLCLIYAVLEELQQRYKRAIDSLGSGFLVLDRAGLIHVINERGAALLGQARPSDLVGSHVARHLPGATAPMVAHYLDRFVAAAPHYPYVDQMTVELPGAGRVPLQLIASPSVERGQLYCLVQVIDLTESKNKDAQLVRAARYDSVTGHLNRYGLSLALRRALAQAGAGECAVLFVDVDKFKHVNDAFGHLVGDQLLHQLAQRLHGLLRPDALLGRFGGDEFVIVLPGLGAGTAAATANACGADVMRALGASFPLAHQTVTVSVSIGVACYPAHGSDADTLIRNADVAMYAVKQTARGAMRFFDETIYAYSKAAIVIDTALRGAIGAGELRLVYQPITEAGSGRMVKLEALLRWHSATLGQVAPDRFIPVAEDSGLIVELGTWVLHEACRQVAAWRARLGPLTVSVNVSARQLIDPAFVGLVERALAAHGLAPQQLELELTERVLIDDGAGVRSTLERLSALGVSISLDDFGTGYSSLNYLTQFHINTLKIDRSFVAAIEHGERSKNLAAAIVAMGRSLGMQVIAEGVETSQQAATLERMGCHYLQGYYIARPLAPDDVGRRH